MEDLNLPWVVPLPQQRCGAASGIDTALPIVNVNIGAGCCSLFSPLCLRSMYAPETSTLGPACGVGSPRGFCHEI